MIDRWRRRRLALEFGPGEGLPFDADLALLARTPAPAVEAPAAPVSSHAAKRHAIAREMAGCSELALLNAICIAHLRKRRFPDGTAQLFHRIWREQGEALLAELPVRWLVSSLITFGDHGTTEAERRLGAQMGVLFGLLKLYEAERLYSGRAPEDPFPLHRRAKAVLPMGLPGFSLPKGGLDVNLLAPLWAEARVVPVAGPIALALLDRLNADAGTIFRRIARMRERIDARRAARDPGCPPADPDE